MKNILIVDDHEVVRRGLRSLLVEKMPGARFVEAATSEEAEARIFEGRWDLFLLDLNLPGRSGLEVLGLARKHCPRTPVIVLTMFSEAEFALRAIKLGAQRPFSTNKAPRKTCWRRWTRCLPAANISPPVWPSSSPWP